MEIVRMIRSLLALLVASALAGELRAQTAGADFSVFLEERVALIAEDPGIPPEALPSITLRADTAKENLVVVFDCDARNLNPPEGEAAPYVLELSFSPPDAPRKFAFQVEGSRSTETVDLRITPAPGLEKEAIPTGATARQLTREDGIVRVSIAIPQSVLAEVGVTEHVRWQAIWRQLTGFSEDRTPVYATSGGLVLSLPGTEADFLLRSPLPADVAAMLTMYAASEDVRCAERCLRRLLWVGRRDESLRGALVMALEHADPTIRRAAARVWADWSITDTPGLPELKEKAAAILAEPAP